VVAVGAAAGRPGAAAGVTGSGQAALELPRRPQSAPAPAALPRFDRRTLVVAGALFAVLMAVSPRYGFHRDELYFLDAARHLQGGYVDQPVLTPLLARVTLTLFGVSLPGLRLWPALAAFATVVVGTLTARELGGGRRAQLLAALGTATMPVVVAADHLDGPTASDMLAWAALALVVVRVGRTGDTRGWLAGGAVLGVGLTNKHSVGSFAVAVLVGLSRAAGAGSSSTADSSPAPCSPPPSSSRISASRHRTAGRPSR